MADEYEIYEEMSNFIYDDDMDGLKEYLEEGNDPNSEDEDGNTPLFTAVDNGNMEAVKILIDHGAEADHRNRDDYNALLYLGVATSLPILKYLHEHGAAFEGGGTTILHAQATINDEEFIELVDILEENEFDFNYVRMEDNSTPLMHNLHSSHRAKALIDKGAEYDGSITDDADQTLLHYAVEQCNSLELFELLADANSDFNAQSELCNELLFSSVQNNNLIATKFFLDKGADINARDENGNLCSINLHKDSMEALNFLLENGLKLDDIISAFGKCPFGGYGVSIEFMQFLLDNNADINAKCDGGNTALFNALGDLEKLHFY